MESILTQMLSGKIPAVVLFEDDRYAAILEPKPLLLGHTIVFPKQVTDAFFDLEPEVLTGLMFRCQRIARALKATIPCDKIAVLVYGIQTRHAHVHLIPVQGDAGEMNLDKVRPAADPTELESLSEKLRGQII